LIAFEGATITDFYELNASKRKQCDLNKITRVFKTQLAPIWSATREFTPFYEYALENCNSLDFVGIDSNFGMTHSMSSALLKILEEDYNIRNNQEFEYEIFRSQFKELISKSYDLDLLSFDFDLFEQNLNLLKKIVNDNQNRESNKSEFIIQELSNLSLNANAIRKGLDRGNQMRDRQMADNLIWVLNNRPINEKVIVWTANFHSAKKLKEAIFNEQENFYEHYTTFAEFVSDAYGFDNVYSIATTSSTGKHNTFSKLDSIIAPEGSWEFQFANNSKMDYGFINYSQINKTSIGDQEFESVILGHVPHLGKWYKIFDGVLFIKKMKPSNFYYWENYE
ncbi:MAG: erythromycin esterase family protein, partial [Bacteroidota bacterium]|nr:erythromycin esterase family protein [Bacteroidota bacterium]